MVYSQRGGSGGCLLCLASQLVEAHTQLERVLIGHRRYLVHIMYDFGHRSRGGGFRPFPSRDQTPL